VISSVYDRASLQDKGIVTGKVFEEIGVGTQLLVIAPEGSDLDGILAETGLGRRFAGTEVDRISACLQELISGGMTPARNPELFSWINISAQLDGVLRNSLEPGL
jgi:hypothetical protein